MFCSISSQVMWISTHCNVNLLFPSIASVEMGILYIKIHYFRVWVAKYPKVRKLYQYPVLAHTICSNTVWRNNRGRFNKNSSSKALNREGKRWAIDRHVCMWDSANNFMHVNIIQVIEYTFWKEVKWLW